MMVQKHRRKSDFSFLDVFGAWGIVGLLVAVLLLVSMLDSMV